MSGHCFSGKRGIRFLAVRDSKGKIQNPVKNHEYAREKPCTWKQVRKTKNTPMKNREFVKHIRNYAFISSHKREGGGGLMELNQVHRTLCGGLRE